MVVGIIWLDNVILSNSTCKLS